MIPSSGVLAIWRKHNDIYAMAREIETLVLKDLFERLSVPVAHNALDLATRLHDVGLYVQRELENVHRQQVRNEEVAKQNFRTDQGNKALHPLFAGLKQGPSEDAKLNPPEGIEVHTLSVDELPAQNHPPGAVVFNAQAEIQELRRQFNNFAGNVGARFDELKAKIEGYK